MNIRTGFVYSLWSGRFQCKKATINNYPTDSRNAGLAYARFLDGGYVEINQSPSQIHNAIVWLEERNDALAADILIQYQEQQIAKIQDKIGNYRHKIQILKDGIKEEF